MPNLELAVGQWNDYRDAAYRIDDASDWDWSRLSGAVNARAPRPFVHGYVSCDAMIGVELGHSCLHGKGPHCIKVCVTKKMNKAIWNEIDKLMGPTPERKSLSRNPEG